MAVRRTRRLVRFQVKGLDRLGKKFRSLDAAARRKILPRAVIAGMEPIGQAIEDRAPVGPSRTARLIRSITSIITHDRPYFARGDVGPRAPHAHLVERGHRIVVGKGSSASQRGVVPPHPFVAPAWKASKRRALSATIRSAREDIFRAVRGPTR